MTRRPRMGPAEIFILLVIGVIGLVVVTRNHEALLQWVLERLTGGTSALIAVIMLVEYLLLKGADRSEIYRRELELARLRRRDDLLTLRQIETELAALRDRLNQPTPENQPDGDAPQRLADARGVVDRLLNLLHPPR